jgi:ubiquinone/menaquinone biosynthesis C-methylase UbiE
MEEKLKPNWAGEDLLSRFVNLLINTKPLYQIMKNQARNVLIKTAEENGVPWRKNYQELENSNVKQLLKEITNPNVSYPDYYNVPFHAYDEGNMCWKAAFEAYSATYAMALRVWKNEKLTPETAHNRLRGSFHNILSQYLSFPITNVLDVGCSVGISTLALHRYLSQQQKEKVNTIGLDLSPYMLAVAKQNDLKQEISQWVHGLAEKTDFEDNYFDLITVQFLLHELPNQATKDIFQEIFRILKPGGYVAIVDNNPRSKVIQNLPPALFLLMKSTEPWSDEYYTFEVEETLKNIGFDYKTTIESDPRHRTIIAFKSP